MTEFAKTGVLTLQEAHRLHEEGKLEEAEKQYIALLNKHHDNWALLQYLGCLYLQQGKNGLAMALFRRSLELNKECPETWNDLGLAYKNEFQHEQAKKCYFQSMKYDKSTENEVKVLANLTGVYVAEGNPEEGLPLALRAISLKPGNVGAHWNLALMLLEMGNYKDGFKEYEWGLMLDPNNKTQRHSRTYAWTHDDGTAEPCPLWDGTKGKTVVVYGEQGIGDEIMFASCIPDLMRDCKEVIFDCHPRLERLFRDSFPGVILHPTRKEDTLFWRGEHRIDYQVAIGSLPYFYRRNGFEKKAYLKAHPKPKTGKPRIGIGWIGGAKSTRIEVRSMHLRWLLPILQQDAEFYSLQYNDKSSEIKDVDVEIIETGQEKSQDYGECADLVAGLDLVIAVNTSVVHLAGALGVPCWTLTPNKPAWRYGIKGEDMLWYPSVRQFRQGKDEDWGKVIERVSNELKGYLADHGRVQEAERAVA